ncbi:hypothetical protein AAG570_000921 [Ranatra chinensis]|uniref:DNTTIP1 dimerisation domain-containing protein n=1 Tax=Ranatra chinensis TaxID=642074 RepID=A0ABD0YYR9_9HEMI
MVVRQRSISYSAVQVPPSETSLKDPLKDVIKEITSEDTETAEELVPWKNTFNMRPLTLAALTLSRPPSKSYQTPLSRMRCRNIVSAAKSLDILRQNLQSAINKEIDLVIKKYLEKFFEPAVSNIRKNLGSNSVSEDLVREVCRTMLEEAKQMYCAGFTSALHRTSPFTDFEIPLRPSEQKRKMSEVENGNKQKKRASPLIAKWDPSRVTKETQFILSTIAGKCLGLGSLRGRLCVKHPDIVRYGVDQDDREWLGSARVSGLNSSIPSIYLMFLEDIVELANNEEYRSSTNVILSELKGFEVPDFIQRKIRAYMTLMRAKHIANQSANNVELDKVCIYVHTI